MSVTFTHRALCRLSHIVRCATQLLRHSTEQPRIGPRNALRSPPTHKFHPPILADLTALAHQHHSNLRGPLHMRPATRLQVHTFNLHGPQNSAALHFLTHTQLC